MPLNKNLRSEAWRPLESGSTTWWLWARRRLPQTPRKNCVPHPTCLPLQNSLGKC